MLECARLVPIGVLVFVLNRLIRPVSWPRARIEEEVFRDSFRMFPIEDFRDL